MDLIITFPEWLVWCATGAAGALALVAIAGVLETALELEAS